MCGICGIVDFSRAPISSSRLQKMTDVIAHRGPDDQGEYLSPDGSVGLGHRRLSIIDLSERGHQPMSSTGGRYWIVFNGEIYDFQETRAKLEKEGWRFATETDTEVILALYERHGTKCVDYLRGMFAFAIWDDRDKVFFAARDRLGKKPFFYSTNDRELIFASELKSLTPQLRGPEVDPDALDQYLAFGYVPAPLTIYRNVFKLPPAHWMQVTAEGLKVQRYWDLDFTPVPVADPNRLEQQVENLIREAVRLRLISDVPLGALLSGGVDSSVIVALMAQEGGSPPKTFSIGFEEADYSELSYARKVAQHVGAEHHEQILRPDVLTLLTQLVDHFDEPFADSSMIPTFLVSQHARQHITVALSGDGGDEVFGGYPRYLYETLTNQLLRIPGAKGAASLASNLWRDSWRGKLALHKMKYAEGIRYAEQMSLFHSDARRLLYINGERDGAQSFIDANYASDKMTKRWTPLARLQYLDTVVGYLPGDILTKVDMASMLVSLEMRSPLLDQRLVSFMAHVPDSYKIRRKESKYLLKKIGEKLLPAEVLYRRKQGFTLPLSSWFRKDLREYVTTILLDQNAQILGVFRRAELERILEEHIELGLDRTQMIFALLSLELWFQRNSSSLLDSVKSASSTRNINTSIRHHGISTTNA